MQKPELSRREFNQLTTSVLAGMVSGLALGCGEEKAKPVATPASTPAKKDEPEVAKGESDVHVCRGLNACKGKGSDGKNDCAGKGTCASVAAKHECGTHNECKGQGGCGSNPAQNECKGKGGCSVPLMDHAWDEARKHFEEQMKKQGKDVGEAPAPVKKS